MVLAGTFGAASTNSGASIQPSRCLTVTLNLISSCPLIAIPPPLSATTLFRLASRYPSFIIGISLRRHIHISSNQNTLTNRAAAAGNARSPWAPAKINDFSGRCNDASLMQTLDAVWPKAAPPIRILGPALIRGISNSTKATSAVRSGLLKCEEHTAARKKCRRHPARNISARCPKHSRRPADS